MKVREMATMRLQSVEPSDSIVTVAQKMKEADVGFIPVVERGHPIGVITDRDIAIRGVAEMKEPLNTTAKELMTAHVHTIQETEDVQDAAWVMANSGVRRLLVINQHGFAVGVVSLDDLALFTRGDQTAGHILTKLAEDRQPRPTFVAF